MSDARTSHPLPQREDLARPPSSSATMVVERATPPPHNHRCLGQEAEPETLSTWCSASENESSQASCEQKKRQLQQQTSHSPPGGDAEDRALQEPGVRCSEAAGGCCSSSSSSKGAVPSSDSSARSSAKGSSSSSSWKSIDTALNTLKSELMAMREQDLQLLKQLININDNIRRLKRARWLQRGGARTASCGFLGSRGSATLPPGCGTQGLAGPGKDRTSMLLRQRSEPGLLGRVPYRKVSALTSTSSFGTIEDEDEDEEEADSLYGSSSDLPSDSSSPAPSPFSPAKPSTPPSPLIRSSSAYTSLTFTQEELWRGESSYGEILKRNIRLWKWSVARERDSGVVDGHPCVL